MKGINIILVICLLASAIDSKIIVLSPKRLSDLFRAKTGNATLDHAKSAFPGVINSSYGNFGFIPYGHAMQGRLFFDPKLDTMCAPIPEQEFHFHNNTHERRREVSTPIMIAERGNCSFVTKVRNMEEAGVAVALIVDDQSEDVDDIVMSDDGTGAGVRIPSLLVSKKDGAKLIDFLKTASEQELKQISLVVDFDVKRPDNRVEYDVWYSSSNEIALDFIQDFMKIDSRFGEQVLMTPRFVFWECRDCDDEFLEENCFGGGKYCATETGNPLITGTDIVLEDLRQMCVYDQAYNIQGDRQLFWDYIKEVHEECDNVVNEDCSSIGHKRVEGLDWDQTQECVTNSFSTPDKSQWGKITTNNTMIDKDLKYWAKYGSNLFPSVVINNQTFRGQLETQAVMNAICAGFLEPPRMCKRLLHAANIEHDVGLGVIYYHDGYRIHHVLSVFVLCLLVLAIVLCLYRRHARREMKEHMNIQIEEAVNKYVSLGQGEDEPASNDK